MVFACLAMSLEMNVSRFKFANEVVVAVSLEWFLLV